MFLFINSLFSNENGYFPIIFSQLPLTRRNCLQKVSVCALSFRVCRIFSRLSEGLLIFHNWFACFHCVLQDKYVQLSHKSNIYEKHTCHWKNALLTGLGTVCEGSHRAQFSLPCWWASSSCSCMIMAVENKGGWGWWPALRGGVQIVFTCVITH